MNRQCHLQPLLLLLLLLFLVSPAGGAAEEMDGLLPPLFCGDGWRIEGKPLIYDANTLSDRINGEAELYFPYGFDRLAAARYTTTQRPGTGMDVEIYRLGSLLDAFGMFANYRQSEGRSLPAGAEANLSGSQLFLYQGRYFLHLQMTGAGEVDAAALTACARSAVSRLPGNSKRPVELAVLDRQEVVKRTERYLPQSLLGYDFFQKGIIAEASLDGKSLQVFLLLGTTVEAAEKAFDSYRAQLANAKTEGAANGLTFLEGVDPLYGPVILLRKTSCLVGALRFTDKKGIRSFLESFCR